MKKLLTIASCLFSGIMLVQAQNFETATEAVKNMGLGWNLGNTLDANDGGKCNGDPTTDGYWGKQGLESEICWGQPYTTPELIQMFKGAGFGAIRVPVTWYNHMDANGKVDAAWMKRVHEVVDYVIDAGLYCIINVHHDTGADSGSFASWIKADSDNYNRNKERYEGLWKQIAEEFKDYDHHLLFAAYNEMLDIKSSWCYASFNTTSRYDATIAASAYKAINSYAQSFCNVVRATGGNNAKRNLVLNTYGSCNGSGTWNSHLKDPLKEMKMPEGESNHIIFEVHNYPSITNLASAKKEFDQNIKDLQETLGALGAPIVYGEWGTSSNNNDGSNDYSDNRDNLFNFVTYALHAIKAAGMTSFWWMGLSDGNYRSQLAFNQPDLAETMAKAWHGDSFQGTYPALDTSSKVYEITYNSDWQEANLLSDKTIKTSDYKGIRVVLGDVPAEGALQVKFYPSETADPISATDVETVINFDSSVLGSNIERITLQTMIGAQTVILSKAFLIRADGTEEELSGFKPYWGCTVEMKDMPTAIHPLPVAPSVDEAPLYNLSGQRVAHPRPGIYIRQGKKMVVR